MHASHDYFAVRSFDSDPSSLEKDLNTCQYITRVVDLDIGHRIMNERVKCYSLHGHRVKVELTFSFTMQQDIGYCVDFKEIKRIGGEWLDDHLDHGFIANPSDHCVIKACRDTNSKLYLMSLNGTEIYCNPTAENIAREILIAMEILFKAYSDLKVHCVRYHETPNCFVTTYANSIGQEERQHFYTYRGASILEYAKAKGVFEYDDRKVA
ncbi:MAG TPA: 6-carboxytetrahydropterin synthase [Chthoniobacterales bacterium]|nr:6-carboxytetrahydropterin synthase [Chthoniobacterales bacterium]